MVRVAVSNWRGREALLSNSLSELRGGESLSKVSKARFGLFSGYFMLGLASFSTIIRELMVVEMNGLQILRFGILKKIPFR